MPRVTELNHKIDEKLPIEIGEIAFTRDYDYPVRGFRTHQITMHCHNGTHVDAPEHTEPGGASIDKISPDVLYGDAVMLDLSRWCEEDKPFTREHVEQAESEAGGIRAGDFAVLRSDWSHTFGTARYWPRSPYLSADAARYLVEDRKVRGLGYDFSQEAGARDHQDLQERIDRGEAVPGEDLVIHHIVLGSGLFHVECMANLDQVESKRFTIVVAPLPLAGVEAAPARVFAIEHD